MAKLSDFATAPNTPTPKKKGGRSKNAYPDFTPAENRVTRAKAKAAGDTMEPLAARNFDAPVRAAKKTKIPPGIGLEQIPSPGNLKVVRKMRGAAKKEKTEVEDVIKDMDELDLDKKQKSKAGKASKKDKVGVAEPEKEKDELKAQRIARSKSISIPAKGKGKGKATSTAGKTPSTLAVSDGEDDETETFDLNPIIPPALSLQSRITRTNPTTATSISNTEVDVEALLASFAPFLSTKKLWEMDWDDVDDLRGAADKVAEGSESEMVLKGMADVVDKFQAFRDGLDEYLHEVEKLGLGLVWEDEGEEEDK